MDSPQDPDELVLSSGSDEWVVHAGYEVGHGVLRGGGDVRHRYLPLGHPEIVGEIGKLHEGDERRARAFAETWGLLGYGVPSDQEGIPVQVDRGDFKEKVIVLSPGDPLPWVWAHARGIRMILELQFYLQRADWVGLAQFVESYPRVASPRGLGETILLSVGAPATVLEQRFSWSVTAPAETARNVIVAIMNVNLSEVHYRVAQVAGAAGLRRTLGFRSLVAVAYWHLLDVVTGARRLARCRDPKCSALFIQADRRQRFCPPPPEWRAKTGSLCGARYRKRGRTDRKEG